MDTTSVMVVDDEEIVCDRLKEHLESGGFEVDTFTNSTEALEALARKRYHVVVSDLKMAGPSGMDVLRNVKSHGDATQVIIITGRGSFESAREAEAVGAFEFLPKPFQLKHLTKLVKKASKRAKRAMSPG